MTLGVKSNIQSVYSKLLNFQEKINIRKIDLFEVWNSVLVGQELALVLLVSHTLQHCLIVISKDHLQVHKGRSDFW